MLEIRDYSITELRELLGTTDKQGIDRKLTGYGVEFSSAGWADNRIYTITAIPDPFKMYAITKLGIPAQADFTKIRNLYFYFFCVDGFADWPMTEMEAILEEDGKRISPKTISKWLHYLEQNSLNVILHTMPSIKPPMEYNSTGKSVKKPIWKVGASTLTAGTKKAAGVPTSNYATTSAGIPINDPALTIT